MSKLWYGSDEVNEFHPIVEECLNNALKIAKLDEKYFIKHHYGNFTTGIPDFALLDKKTNDFVCIIEVKKTPSDVFYFGTGYQAKGYVDELYPLRWKPKFHPFFCVTNIEITQFYCWRENSTLIGCLQTGSPHDCGLLEDGDNCYNKFTLLFSEYFKSIDILKTPEFSMHLEAISESFNETFFSISKILGVNLVRMTKLVQANEDIKKSILYELLRFAFYYYIKEYYALRKSSLSNYFKDFEIKNISDFDLLNTIEENFSKAMEIDFKDILQNYNSKEAIIPYKLKKDKELTVIFNNFIKTLRENASQGIKKNNNLLNFVSLLTAEIYDKSEMHSTGKIMSDEVLSNILSELTIKKATDSVIDPCCGDGNLLISAYNRLKKLNKVYSHNKILSQLNGIELDPNLIQLGAFKLICSNLEEVNKSTFTNLKNVDLFETENKPEFDVLIMNPPFLRNEDVKKELKEKYLKNLEKVSGNKSFIRDVAQPNLYFYFIEKAISLLNQDGRASIILMSKFLNNKDGKYLKEFLMPYLEAVISYPPDFFEGFAVTTSIILLSKKASKNKKVTFLRLKNTDLLSNLDLINKIIEEKENEITKNYSILKIDAKELNPEHNWRLYLIDPGYKFKYFEELDFLNKLSNNFGVIKRGKSDNCGGSSLVYPDSSNNPLADKVNLIESRFIGYGLQRNKLNGARRKMILTKECLNSQKGLIFPSKFDSNSKDGITKSINDSNGLREYWNSAKSLQIKEKEISIERIQNSSFDSIATPDIVIPRADREKHIVYFNPIKNKPILISTNFFFMEKFKNFRENMDEEIQKKFIAAFLNSTFGQIQFEIHANNQEGMRKIEGFMIEKIKIPDLNKLTDEEIKEVVKQFDILNSLNKDFVGVEKNNIRTDLDFSIAKIIFKRNNLGFSDIESLTKHFEEFLKEIVFDRINKEEE